MKLTDPVLTRSATSEWTGVRDEFSQQRIREGKNTPGEVGRPFNEAMESNYEQWQAERG